MMVRTAPVTFALAALAGAALASESASAQVNAGYPAATYPAASSYPATTYPAVPTPGVATAAPLPPAGTPAPAPAGTSAAETRFPDTAVVVSSTPIYQRVVEPAQQCRLETYPSNDGSPDRQVERCYDTTRERQVVRAYSVVYRYGDRQFTAELPYDPGPRLRVDVAINPIP
jgi:uncharacterized protein YcfJ